MRRSVGFSPVAMSRCVGPGQIDDWYQIAGFRHDMIGPMRVMRGCFRPKAGVNLISLNNKARQLFVRRIRHTIQRSTSYCHETATMFPIPRHLHQPQATKEIL
jgi:hypothetical protein